MFLQKCSWVKKSNLELSQKTPILRSFSTTVKGSNSEYLSRRQDEMRATHESKHGGDDRTSNYAEDYFFVKAELLATAR